MTVNITFEGCEFAVEGNYQPFTPAKLTADPYYSHPPEGGEWNDYRIMMGDVDLTDWLRDTVVDRIIEAASEAAEKELYDRDDYVLDFEE